MYEIISSEGSVELIDARQSELSIRLEPDGLSFCVRSAGNKFCAEVSFPHGTTFESVDAFLSETTFLHGEFVGITLNLITEKVALVPVEAYIADCKEKYFEVGAIALSVEDSIIEIKKGGIISLVAINSGVLISLTSHFSDMNFTHPLLQMVCTESPENTEIRVSVAKRCTFIALFTRGKLICAEALPVSDFPSLLFFVNRLIVFNKLGKVKIVCSGYDAEEISGKFGEYYSDVEVRN